MSDDLSSLPDLASIDLSFGPSWVKETGPSERLNRLAEKHEREERPERGGKAWEGRGGPRQGDRRPPRRDGGGRQRDGKARRSQERRDDRRPAREERPQAPLLRGWEAQFIPEARGIEGLAKQIRTTAKAYPLFDLARLVLERPERYRVEFRQTEAAAPALFQVLLDGSLWLSEGEAITHAVAHQFEKHYRRERVTVEPPKGNYQFVAVCGMSGVLLGPPNYHDYQAKLRQLHAQRFANMPFDAFKSRVRMERDEAAIQKWKEEQSSRDEYVALDASEGTEPAKFASLGEVERHFRQNYAAAEIVRVAERAEVPGVAAATGSAPGVQQLTRRAWEELQRFPLPLAHVLGQALAQKGLHIFKAHENVTYVSVARPRFLDRAATPISESLSGILVYLEEHPKEARAEQWKGLLALRPVPAESSEAAREQAVLADLSWLLHEGYVVDYAGRGLVATRRPKAKEGKAPEAPLPVPVV